jgi:hypothetical protein
VSLDVHASVEHSKQIDPHLIHDQVRNPVVTVRRFADLTIADRFVPLPESGMLTKQLHLCVDA